MPARAVHEHDDEEIREFLGYLSKEQAHHLGIGGWPRPAGGSFFKRPLLGRTGLRVARSRYQLAPLMALEEAVDCGLSDLMANDGLQSGFDVEPRAHLAHLTLLQKLVHHRLLLLQAEVGTLPLPSTRSLQRAGTVAIVGRY